MHLNPRLGILISLLKILGGEKNRLPTLGEIAAFAPPKVGVYAFVLEAHPEFPAAS